MAPMSGKNVRVGQACAARKAAGRKVAAVAAAAGKPARAGRSAGKRPAINADAVAGCVTDTGTGTDTGKGAGADRARAASARTRRVAGKSAETPAARGWTKTRRREFLEHLAATMNVRASARAVGVSERGAYRLRARDEDFRAGWRDAIAEAYERLELEMLRRAIGDADGAATADARNPDARLAMFLMKMHRETARGGRDAGGEDDRDPAVMGDALEAKLADMRERMGLTEAEPEAEA